MGTFSPPFSGRIQTLESQHLTSGGAGLGPGAGERGGKAGGNDLEDSRRTWARPPALLLPGRALRPRAGRTASRGTGHRPPGADGILSPGVGLGCGGHGRTAGSSRPLRLCRARGEISGRLRLGDSCQRPAASRLTHSPGFWAPGEGWGCLGRCCFRAAGLGSSGDASSHLPPSRWTPAP